MCRKNHLWGFGVMTFGLGLLIGCWMESELTQTCFGLALIAGGVFLIRNK